MWRPQHARDDDGFTLVELVISLTIIAVGVFGVMGVLTSTFGVSAATSRRSQAVALVTKEIESFRATPYADLTVDPNVATRTEPVGGTSYTVTSGLTWSLPGSSGYKQATVDVSWSDASGFHAVHQSSYLYPGGLGPAATTTTTVACTGGAAGATTLTGQVVSGSTPPAIDLAWTVAATSAPAPASWRIDRSSDSGSTWVTISASVPTSSRSYRDGGLTSAASYTYRVGALDACGQSVPWSPTTTVATPAAAVATCELRTPNVTPSQVKLGSNGNNAGLATPPIVSVQTSGSCSGLTVRYQATASAALKLLPMSSTTGGFTAQLDDRGPWDVGVHTIDLLDSTAAVRGSLLLTVCQQKATTCG